MRQKPDALMIFAAGFGTRMRPFTEHMPKPLVEVAGAPLIDHAVALATNADIGTIVANAHYRASQLVGHLAGGPVTVLEETPEILDTGGGLKAALRQLDRAEAVFTLNSDAIWTGLNPLTELRKAWDPSRMDALLMLVEPLRAKEHKGEGDFLIDPSGRLRRGPGMIYTGAQIIKTEALSAVPERVFSMWRLWEAYLVRNSMFGLVHRGGWCDVGHPEAIAMAEALLAGDDDV